MSLQATDPSLASKLQAAGAAVIAATSNWQSGSPLTIVEDAEQKKATLEAGNGTVIEQKHSITERRAEKLTGQSGSSAPAKKDGSKRGLLRTRPRAR